LKKRKMQKFKMRGAKSNSKGKNSAHTKLEREYGTIMFMLILICGGSCRRLGLTPSATERQERGEENERERGRGGEAKSPLSKKTCVSTVEGMVEHVSAPTRNFIVARNHPLVKHRSSPSNETCAAVLQNNRTKADFLHSIRFNPTIKQNKNVCIADFMTYYELFIFSSYCHFPSYDIFLSHSFYINSIFFKSISGIVYNAQ